VYFESVAMFVFFLLTARFLESRGRERSVRQLEELARALPATAMRRCGRDGYELVMASSLVPGDEVLVRPGDAIPADGIVTDGSSNTDESLLTGESRTIPKAAGATVLGGSVNLDAPLSIRITRDCGASTLSQIVRLSDRAQRTKPHVAQVADRVAGWFVAAVLILAAITAAIWWVRDPALWLPVTISVLVVTCPCALSLATPTAMAAAVTHLAQRGMVTLRRDALEALATVDHVMLDKTGTLTAGALRITGVRSLGAEGEARSLQIARALERHSNHPVAGAFRNTGDAGMKDPVLDVKQLQFVAGAGITGEIDGRRYALGREDWVTTTIGVQLPAVTGGDATQVWLANDHGPVAVFELSDRLREDAGSALDELRALDLDVSICSGDREEAVHAAALQLHVDDYRYGLSPDDKLAYVRDLQNRGARMLAVGDGINDAPVLSAAHASIAMARGADITHNRADLVLLNDSLKLVPAAVRLARRARAVIHQNLVWAAGYNLLALPAAVMGLVPPWLAAIGMSASSLIVVANALRLAPAAPRRHASRAERA